MEKLKQLYEQMLQNGVRLPLVNDPKSKTPSISYTLLVVSFMYATVAIALNIAKITENTSSAMELFYATAALYFGRALSVKGQDYSGAKQEEKKEE